MSTLAIVMGGILILASVLGLVNGTHGAETLGTWVAALLTLAIFSFLYKDNPVYKLAEHIFIGISAGYFVALEFWNVFIPNLWNPLVQGLNNFKLLETSVFGLPVRVPVFPNMILLVPFALGLLLFTRFSERAGWLSRWSIAAMVGSYAGLAIIGSLQGDLVAQIRANMIPLWDPNSIAVLKAQSSTGGVIFGLLGVLKNPLIIVGLICTLVYFFFSREHRGGLGVASKIGIWFLMISFGASFGYTVMSRVSLLIGRLHFLLSDWLGLIR